MKKHSFKSINVVPFIDVMLVLLAIVLTTASFIAFQQFKVELPDTKHQQAIDDIEKAVSIGINAKGEWILEDSKVDLQSLTAALSKITQTQTLILQIDKASQFNRFTTLLDLLKKYGLEKRAFVLSKES